MQRLGRAAAAVLQVQRCLAAEAASRLQAAPLQQEILVSLSSRWKQAATQVTGLRSWPACCQAGCQCASSSRHAHHAPWQPLPSQLPPQFRAFSSTGLLADQPSPHAAAPEPSPPPPPPQQQQQQQKPGPITGTCRRRDLRCGWKKLDFVLRMIRRSYVDDAMAQLQANPKLAAVYVQHALANARNNAICAGGEPGKLWVCEAYVTKGKYQKRLAIQGRGYSSIKQTRYSHLNLTVRQLEEGDVVAAKLRQRPRTVAPLMFRLQQGQQGRARQWLRSRHQVPQQRGQVAA